ncbi:MAG: YgjV family protein [Clostridia bacterium]|nr:YgjV family protein [Clostridia bacterium]
MEWTINYIFSQVFVVLATICLALTYLTKNKVFILILSCLNAVFFSFNYFLLDSFTGVLINCIGLIRGIWYFIDEKRNKNSIVSMIICSLLILVGGIFTFARWFDAIALFAGVLYTYAIWQKSIVFYRWAGILGSLCFIVFNIFNKSLFGIICECGILVVEVIGICLFYYHKKQQQN